MSRFAMILAFGIFSLGLVTLSVNADDKKTEKKEEKKDEKKKLEGTIGCTKCKLGESEQCGHYIKVKEKVGDKEKEVVYYLKDKGAKEKYHATVCSDEAEGTVEGKVVEKDGKKFIEEPKVEFKK
ncbi:MAG: hypothetical protein ACRCZF_09000 [Gemmataceae bacterium]